MESGPSTDIEQLNPEIDASNWEAETFEKVMNLLLEAGERGTVKMDNKRSSVLYSGRGLRDTVRMMAKTRKKMGLCYSPEDNEVLAVVKTTKKKLYHALLQGGNRRLSKTIATADDDPQRLPPLPPARVWTEYAGEDGQDPIVTFTLTKLTPVPFTRTDPGPSASFDQEQPRDDDGVCEKCSNSQRLD